MGGEELKQMGNWKNQGVPFYKYLINIAFHILYNFNL